MSDRITSEQLRKIARNFDVPDGVGFVHQAADEIERLTDENRATELITECLRHHMDILITEHRATSMTFCQISRPGDESVMIAVDSLKYYPAAAIIDACEQALASTRQNSVPDRQQTNE